MNLQKIRTLNHVFMEQAGADGAAAGGAGDGGAATGADGAGGSGAPAAKSTLAAGADGGGAGAAVAINDLIPEKYRVSKEDGTFDLEASVRKLAPGYQELAKKLGAGDIAPESPDKYEPKVELDGFKWDEVKADPKMQGFLKKMHGKGVSNALLSDILTEYYSSAGDLVGGAKVLTQEECEAELKATVWKTDAELAAGKRAANRVFNAFAEKAGITMEEMEESGLADNPRFLRFLAAIAPELGEDNLPGDVPAGGADSEQDILNIQASTAYWDEKDPGHAAARAKVKSYYEKKFPGAAGLR